MLLSQTHMPRCDVDVAEIDSWLRKSVSSGNAESRFFVKAARVRSAMARMLRNQRLEWVHLPHLLGVTGR